MKTKAETTFSAEDIKTIHKSASRFKPNTEIAIAKLSNEQISFYGVKTETNKEVSEIKNQTSIFEIGSITKVFTSALLAQLATEGAVKLADPIDIYLGYRLNKGQQVTFEELANHTSGLPRLPPSMFWKAVFGSSENPYKDYAEEALKHDLTTRIKLKKKGKSRYSNMGTGVLAHTLGKVTGQTFEAMLQEHIFQPLGMQNSTASKQTSNDLLVPGLNKKGQPCSNWHFDALAGAGAILSSVEDLSKFLRANFDPSNNALQLQQKETVKTGRWDSFALGWMIQCFKTTNDRPWHWHNGGTGGYSSAAVMDTEMKTGVIVLSNVSGLTLFKSQEITNLAFNLHKDMQNTD
ncbi:MAG: serine hydrolase domain-containing protein [Kordiimonas sp.]